MLSSTGDPQTNVALKLSALAEVPFPAGRLIDMSIEFAHVYSDQSFMREHAVGVSRTVEEIGSLRAERLTSSLTVLIDDYNPQEFLLDVSDFLSDIQLSGVVPNYVLFESELQPMAIALLDRLQGRVAKSLARYVESRGHVPCSLFVAAWHLLRLGVADLGTPPMYALAEVSRNGSEPPSPHHPFAGRRSLTILPTRFRDVEARALEIIRASPYARLSTRVGHIFFEDGAASVGTTSAKP